MTQRKPLPEIEPCPFCGGRIKKVDIVRTWGLSSRAVELIKHFNVYCRHCRATGPTRLTERGAIKGWNKGAEPEVVYVARGGPYD